MIASEKLNHIVELDEELLIGGVVLDESIAELIRNADISYVNGANWSTIITSVAAIEGFIKSSCASKDKRFVDLIKESNFDYEVKEQLHNLRRYRNQIVHSSSDIDDEQLINSYDIFSKNEEKVAGTAIRLLRLVAYSEPFI